MAGQGREPATTKGGATTRDPVQEDSWAAAGALGATTAGTVMTLPRVSHTDITAAATPAPETVATTMTREEAARGEEGGEAVATRGRGGMRGSGGEAAAVEVAEGLFPSLLMVSNLCRNVYRCNKN